jgi:hypothetical protein
MLMRPSALSGTGAFLHFAQFFYNSSYNSKGDGMKLRQVILLVTWHLAFSAWAIESKAVITSKTPPQEVIETQNNSLDWKKQPEAIALVEQNKVIKEYHTTLTDTVFFVLSLVGGVAALLVGASYLINLKMYESDKERINEKLTSLKDELNLLRKSQSDVSDALRSELESNIVAKTEQAKNESIVSVQAQLEAYANRATSEMVGLRAEITSAHERHETKFDSIQTKLTDLQAVVTEQKKMIAFVESIAHEAAAETFHIRKYSAARFIRLSQALRAAVESGEAWNVQYILKDIEEAIGKLTESEKRNLSQDTIEIMNRNLEKAGKLAKEESLKVLALVAEIDSFRSTPSA